MLSGIKRDKWKHFLVGVALGLFFEASVLYFFPGHMWTESVVVFLLIGIISYGFELLSLWLRKGHYDVMDAIAGVAGGTIGMAVVILAWLVTR